MVEEGIWGKRGSGVGGRAVHGEWPAIWFLHKWRRYGASSKLMCLRIALAFEPSTLTVVAYGFAFIALLFALSAGQATSLGPIGEVSIQVSDHEIK